MNGHEQFAEDLALYALGTLAGEDRVALETHLRDCGVCREELERLRGDAALLALSTVGPRPPQRSKQRLLSAIAKEPRSVAITPEKKKWAWWSAFEWAGAVALIVVAFLLFRENQQLRQRLSGAEAAAAGQQQKLEEARQLLSTLTSPEADRYVLVAAKTPPQPQGRAIYVASSGTLVFLASHMPKLPAEKAYELWLIPASGAPIPAGVFQPDAEGSAAVVKPKLRPGIEAKTFAITVEPKEGSASPTSPVVMVGERG